MDRVEPGQEFDVERLDRGDYRIVRRAPRQNEGAIDWLLACPQKDFFVPIDSESTMRCEAPWDADTGLKSVETAGVSLYNRESPADQGYPYRGDGGRPPSGGGHPKPCGFCKRRRPNRRSVCRLKSARRGLEPPIFDRQPQ